jgi:alpha-beta hydrolase superfamily lysophospholipase
MLFLPSNYKVPFLFIKIGIVFFLTACSPNFVTLPSSVSSSPSISGHKFSSYDNTELPLRVWLPSHKINGVIIAVHGFNDYSNFIKDSATFFNNQKLAVYSYDQRGFGETGTRGRWSGRQTLSNDLMTFVKLVKKTHPQIPIYILGDSMGGAVTIVTMAKKDPLKVNGVILIAPAVWVRSEMPFYQRYLLWIAAHTIPWKKVTGESLEITASDNIEMLRELGKDPLVIKETRVDVLYGLSNLMDEAYRSAEFFRTNLLLLYGNKDEIIPREPVFEFYKRLPSGGQGQQQMILYENGYHMLLRDLQSEVVMKDIVDWINDQAKPVSSLQNNRQKDLGLREE